MIKPLSISISALLIFIFSIWSLSSKAQSVDYTALAEQNRTYDRNALEQNPGDTMAGIGARLAMDQRSQEGEVMEVFQEMGADLAGMLPGDRIVEVNGENCVGTNLMHLVHLIRGPLDSRILIRIHRATDDKDYMMNVVRKAMPVEAPPLENSNSSSNSTSNSTSEPKSNFCITFEKLLNASLNNFSFIMDSTAYNANDEPYYTSKVTFSGAYEQGIYRDNDTIPFYYQWQSPNFKDSAFTVRRFNNVLNKILGCITNTVCTNCNQVTHDDIGVFNQHVVEIHFTDLNNVYPEEMKNTFISVKWRIGVHYHIAYVAFQVLHISKK